MLSERLLKLRKEARMTQVELSSKLGIARTTYSGYELGTSEPDNVTLEMIADFYGVTTDNLLGREIKESSIEETNRERIIRETQELMKLAKDDQQAQLMLDLAKNVFKK